MKAIENKLNNVVLHFKWAQIRTIWTFSRVFISNTSNRTQLKCIMGFTARNQNSEVGRQTLNGIYHNEIQSLLIEPEL